MKKGRVCGRQAAEEEGKRCLLLLQLRVDTPSRPIQHPTTTSLSVPTLVGDVADDPGGHPRVQLRRQCASADPHAPVHRLSHDRAGRDRRNRRTGSGGAGDLRPGKKESQICNEWVDVCLSRCMIVTRVLLIRMLTFLFSSPPSRADVGVQRQREAGHMEHQEVSGRHGANASHQGMYPHQKGLALPCDLSLPFSTLTNTFTDYLGGRQWQQQQY